jgi:predicted kinase
MNIIIGVNRKPTLYLLCGLPGSGKTTVAKRLEHQAPALRLTPDEWMCPLYGESICEPDALDRWNICHERIESIQWELAERSLSLGVNVVLDFGVWAREERDYFRTRASAVGARSELIFFDEPLDVLKERVKARNLATGSATYLISDTELDHWWGLFQRPAEDELYPLE